MKSFPDYETWMNSVVHPAERQRKEMDLRWQYFRTKNSIVELIKPKKVCEIGVRLGYGAYSFCLTKPDLFHGFDKPDLEGGAFISENPHDHVKKILEPLVEEVKITNIDTNDLTVDMMSKYDFIHVDAGHSYVDAYRDLGLAIQACLPGAFILVDDYDSLPSVKSATDDFVRHNEEKIDSVIYFQSLKGELLIKVSE